MKNDAVISACGNYRYALWRVWDKARPLVMFIGLNPSTADAVKDDNTIRRCIGFAKTWRFGSLSVGNLFAFRATEPRELRKASDPVGPENDKWLMELKRESKMGVAVWGNNGKYLNRDEEVLKMFPGLHCIKVSATGVPLHPLYLPGNLKPIRISEVMV